MAEWALEPALPRFAQIEPVGRCNLACRMCTVHERGDEVAQLSLERFRALLDHLPGLEELHLQGLGEPMMHPAFFDMVALAAQRGIRVSSNSNLTLLTHQRARRCVTCGLAELSVSLDGASAAVYESIRRRASFAKVVRNLQRLVDARDEAGSALAIRGVMVLMRSNLHELPALVRLLHDHGVTALSVQRLCSELDEAELPARYIPIRSYVRAAELTSEDLPRAAGVFDEARAVAAQLGVRLHLPRLWPADAGQRAHPRCHWPWHNVYITAAGEMLPCCMVASGDRASFGPVFNGHGDGAVQLLQRWHGATAQSFRRGLAQDTPPSVCSTCAVYKGTFCE